MPAEQNENLPVAVTDSAEEINAVIANADSFIRKQYLSELGEAQIVPISSRLSEIEVGKNVRLFRLASLSYSEADDFYEKISNIYSVLSESESSQILILDSNGHRAELYMGVASNDIGRLGMQFDTFKGSFLGNFPGGKISVLNVEKNKELINGIFDEPDIRISAVSALTASEQNSVENIYGIERLVDGMHGKPFTMVLISNAVSRRELYALRQGLEAMYTELSPLKNYSISINTSESENRSESLNLTKSESVTEGKSVTESSTLGTSKSRSTSTPKSQEEEKKKAINQLFGTVAAIAGVGLGLGGIGGILQGLYYGSGISGAINSVQTIVTGAKPITSETVGDSENRSLSFSEAETSSIQKGFSSSKGITEGTAVTTGKTVQMSYENKSIMNLMDVLDKQIKRLQHIESLGGFGCAAYFVTGDNTTALTAANMYRSLLASGSSMGQENAINMWSDSYRVEGMSEYLKRLNHPLFRFQSREGYPEFTASTIVSSDEFPMYASLPQKSIRGLTVSAHAEFARETVSSFDDASAAEDRVEIGSIYHMGKTEASKVYLSKNDLSGHMFVAGTTGMGKSNFCYWLLDSLYNSGVKFMVIEPAKGEYHRVFGGLSDVHTFGTNPMLMPLLKINPFSFPEGIHVNEHIDRLLEIFNSCWPMYAAMPAVLKEGMEMVYRESGFNLITGRHTGKRRFPTFKQLLDALPKVLEKSEFSGEVKGNYTGSLVTRVKSLTNGLYGRIFSSDETDSSLLFDENVLIDLSRVGSSETKSLIMGVLVMKLGEYRAASSKMNVPLKHVTLLEEAHHLLRANTSSSAEGVNLRAMSLEMITNAIAEMRTYGEGFLIADQSPALMDLSVIRNTNTKVIFKLPENSDREAVGPAISLTHEQTAELSRLERGVAAVYQGGWDNAVLSKINYFDSAKFKPFEPDEAEFDGGDIKSQCMAVLLKNRLMEGAQSSADRERCAKMTSASNSGSKRYMKVIRGYAENEDYAADFNEVRSLTESIINSKRLIAACGSAENLNFWESKAKKYISALVTLNRDEIKALICLCLKLRMNDSQQMRQLYYRYFGHI